MYRTAITIEAVAAERWQGLKDSAAGTIESLLALLQGKLDRTVMTRMCDQATGLFPAPNQIAFSCSCPDVASMCKHVAAVLYGVGSRLDSAPELLFTLRGVDPAELVTTAAAATSRTGKKRSLRALDPGSDLAALFALDLEPPAGFEKVNKIAKRPSRSRRGIQ